MRSPLPLLLLFALPIAVPASANPDAPGPTLCAGPDVPRDLADVPPLRSPELLQGTYECTQEGIRITLILTTDRYEFRFEPVDPDDASNPDRDSLSEVEHGRWRFEDGRIRLLADATGTDPDRDINAPVAVPLDSRAQAVAVPAGIGAAILRRRLP